MSASRNITIALIITFFGVFPMEREASKLDKKVVSDKSLSETLEQRFLRTRKLPMIGNWRVHVLPNGTPSIYNLKTHESVMVCETQMVHDMAVSPCEKLLATAALRSIALWRITKEGEFDKGTLIRRLLEKSEPNVNAIAFDETGNLSASFQDGSEKKWTGL